MDKENKLILYKDEDDYNRVGNAYIDAQNMAEKLKLDVVWTANHIKREGYKHRLHLMKRS